MTRRERPVAVDRARSEPAAYSVYPVYAVYAVCVCTAAYGLMKLAQALGANALADKDPLPPELRQRLLARDPLFVAGHWIMFAVAVAGILVALATVRPWGRRVPRRLLLTATWTAGVFMVVRAFGPVGYGFVGDTLVLTGVWPSPYPDAELGRHLARWDLTLWSPFFLVWGLLWTVTAWHFTRTGRDGRRNAEPAGDLPPHAAGPSARDRRVHARRAGDRPGNRAAGGADHPGGEPGQSSPSV